jgi:hypothetical protein
MGHSLPNGWKANRTYVSSWNDKVRNHPCVCSLLFSVSAAPTRGGEPSPLRAFASGRAAPLAHSTLDIVKGPHRSMDAAPLVVAFSDSLAVRETLNILLEHDCELRFLGADIVPPRDSQLADLAVVAVRQPAGLLHGLTQHWPTLPIVAVHTATEMAPPITPAHPSMASVPLEPHAIRTAVMQGLMAARYAPLRAAVRMLAESLGAELSYPFAALRSFALANAISRGTDGVFAAIAREQIYLLGDAIDHLERFRARSRRLETSPDFLVVLCRMLERPDTPAERALLCECIIDSGNVMPAGPLALAPVLGSLLLAHLRRRADPPLITIRITPEGALLHYRARPSVQAVSNSWPLLLAALTARPWEWQLLRFTDRVEERIALRPA